MASRKARDVMLPECPCAERDMKGGKVQCFVVWRQAVWWRQASVRAGKRKDRECQRAVCIRRGAVDVVVKVLCGETDRRRSRRVECKSTGDFGEEHE